MIIYYLLVYMSFDHILNNYYSDRNNIKIQIFHNDLNILVLFFYIIIYNDLLYVFIISILIIPSSLLYFHVLPIFIY